MCVGQCIRQAGYGPRADIVLIPTTRDEVGQYGEKVSGRGLQVTMEVCADGLVLWNVHIPFILRHPAEEDVLVRPGLYIARDETGNAGGAPRGEASAE